jgi:hypothetical protein
MPRRAGQSPPPENSRDSILKAWIERHPASIKELGSKSNPLVTKRLKTLVGHTKGAFNDIPAVVHSSGKGSWKAEPLSPEGEPIQLFDRLLERIGPAAIKIVEIGKKSLADPALRQQLIDRGIPVGKSNGEVDHFLALDQGGEALITRLGDEVALRIPGATPLSRDSLLRIAQDPIVLEGAVTSFLTAAVHKANLIAQARTTHQTPDIWVANDDGEAEPIDESPESDGSESLIAAARVLCAHECGVAGGVQRSVTPQQFDEALYDLVSRWAKSDTAGRRGEEVVILDREAKTRFAHTLLHSDYFRYVHEPLNDGAPRESWNALQIWFDTEGIPILQRKCAGVRGLNAHDKADLEQQNIADNLGRLRRIFLDSYVDPRREPVDWSLVRQEITTRRDVEGFYVVVEQSVGGGSDLEMAAAGQAWVAPPDLNPVDTDYWLTRDLPLTQSADYQQFIQNARRHRQPYAMFDELSYFTSRLLRAADEEVGLHQRARLLNTHELEAVEQWIAGDLERSIQPIYQQISKHPRVNRERAERGLLVVGAEIEAAVMAHCPSGIPPQDWSTVALVTRVAFLRAVVVVFGRRATDQAGGKGD